MKLTSLIRANPLETTIYGERYLNDSKGRFEDYSEVNPRFDPQGALPYVNLPYALMPEERCAVFTSEPSQGLLDWVRVGKDHRFFWHPDVLRPYLHIAGSARTQPTSSTRTLLTERIELYQVYIKTDLDKKHFRFVRRLQRSSVEHSIAVCADLRELVATGAATERFAFLPESLGIVVEGGEHEGSGVIFREVTPVPAVQDSRTLLPYHALYASDSYSPQDVPLLVQLVQMHGGGSPLEYFVSQIVGPILEVWVTLVSHRGLLPELHGQNALIEIDADLRPRRAVYRDFQGTYSDSGLRSARNLIPFKKHTAGTEPGTTKQSQYSHVFDGMIGRYLLARLSRVFADHFHIEYAAIAQAIAAYHQNIPDWNSADFPDTTYRFGGTAQTQVGNDVVLVNTGVPPEFR